VRGGGEMREVRGAGKGISTGVCTDSVSTACSDDRTRVDESLAVDGDTRGDVVVSFKRERNTATFTVQPSHSHTP
jgi:hypothetical protein